MPQIPLAVKVTNEHQISRTVFHGQHQIVLKSVLGREVKKFQSKKWAVAQELAMAELALDWNPL